MLFAIWIVPTAQIKAYFVIVLRIILSLLSCSTAPIRLTFRVDLAWFFSSGTRGPGRCCILKSSSDYYDSLINTVWFISVTSKYLGSCWSYRKTKVHFIMSINHSASTEPYFSSLGETFVKVKVEREKIRWPGQSVSFVYEDIKDNCKKFCSSHPQKM